MTTRLLVIGYGNELRRDDGVGPRVAQIVTEWEQPGLKGVAVHQLTPELAELLAEAERVVFVDAGHGEVGHVLVRPLEPDSRASSALVHYGDPRALLALTEALYGRRPRAWLISVPAPDLDFGAGLSPAAERGVAEAWQQVQLLTSEHAAAPEEGSPCTKSA